MQTCFPNNSVYRPQYMYMYYAWIEVHERSSSNSNMQPQATVRSPHSSLLPVADGRGSYTVHIIAVVRNDDNTTAIFLCSLIFCKTGMGHRFWKWLGGLGWVGVGLSEEKKKKERNKKQTKTNFKILILRGGMGTVANHSYMYIKRTCDPPPSEECKRKLWHADSCRWLYNMKG